MNALQTRIHRSLTVSLFCSPAHVECTCGTLASVWELFGGCPRLKLLLDISLSYKPFDFPPHYYSLDPNLFFFYCFPIIL